jgi:hypothetical protein
MASRDRFSLEPLLEPITPSAPDRSQGELFARLALRALPIMKGADEDFWILHESTPRTIH